jgi:dihydrolipoamide dehydrogenase
MGKATLKSSTQVAVEGGDTLTAKNIVIATGARARSLPGLEIDGKNIITSRNALELKDKPKAIAIVGASAIGCEFAYYFNAYGVEVMMFEVLPHLVPKEDEDISKELERQFKKQGINFATGAKVKSVDKKDGRLLLKYEDAEGNPHQFTCDKVMLGVGVQPNTDGIGLEDVGVELDRGFIKVNDHMQTSVNGVYAVGDVTGKLMLAHVAFDQGVIAAETVAGHEPMLIDDYADMPRCTYCQPEIASIGLTEKEARDKGIPVKIGRVPFPVAGKSIAIGQPDGFAKVIANENTGEIVGAHIIGAGATEMIAEVGMLRLLEGTNLELHKMTHAHPTLSEVIKEAGASVTGEAIHF